MSRHAPPSYDSIVARFEQHLGSNPKPQEVLDAVEKLPQYEIDVLVDNADKIPALTPDQKAAFTVGMAKTMSSEGAARHLKTAATDASAACKAIECMFTNLRKELARIDAKHVQFKEGAFIPRFNFLNEAYRQTVHNSKDLAVEIAAYGQRFDSVIIPICEDRSFTIERRKAKLEEFIKDADAFSEKATAMEKRFNKLKDDFTVFVGSFGGWASEKEADDKKELVKARQNLADLKNALSKLRVALVGVGAVAATSLPVTALLAPMSGPILPFVIIGGLIVAGVSTIGTVGLQIAINSKQEQIEAEKARIDALEKSADDIKTTRCKLEMLGSEDLIIFNTNIASLASIWTHVHNDALLIKKWLEGGEKEADMPKYMKVSIDHAVSIYETMAVYLLQYADGIVSANVPIGGTAL